MDIFNVKTLKIKENKCVYSKYFLPECFKKKKDNLVLKFGMYLYMHCAAVNNLKYDFFFYFMHFIFINRYCQFISWMSISH